MPRLKVELDADGSKMARGLNAAGQNVKNWAGNVKGWIAGAVGAGAIKALLDSTTDFFDELGNQAKQADMSVEKLQNFNRIVKDTKGGVEGLKNSLTNMREAQVTAIEDPESKQAQAFAKLGFSRNQLNKMGQEDLLGSLMERTKNLNLTQFQHALGDIFPKKQIGDLFSVRNELTANGQNEAMKLARSKGLISSQEDIDRLKDAKDEYEDQLTRLKVNSAGLAEEFLNLKIALGKLFNFILENTGSEAKAKKVIREAFEKGLAQAGIKTYGKNHDVRVDSFPGLDIAEIDRDKAKEAQAKFAKERLSEIQKDMKEREGTLTSVGKNYNAGIYSESSELARGNFAGTNMSLLQSAGQQQIDILKSIDRTNKELLRLEREAKLLAKSNPLILQP